MHDQIPKIFCYINQYDKNYIKRLNKNIAIIYRNYTKTINHKEINNIKKICKKTKRKFYLANDIKNALKFDLDGVYIPSFNKNLKINAFAKKKKFKILGSAHNLQELKIKELQRVDCIFLSPIFKIKKTNKFLDIIKFNNLRKNTKKKIICLGGIKINNLNKLNLVNAYGFASVSLFRKKIKYIRI